MVFQIHVSQRLCYEVGQKRLLLMHFQMKGKWRSTLQRQKNHAAVMKLDVMRVPSCKSHVRYCYIYTLHIIRQSMAQIWGQTSEHINQVLSRGTTHDAQPWSHDAPSRIVEVEKRVAHLIQWKELYNTDHMYSMIRTWNGVQYLSKKIFFEWLSQLILWHLLPYVLGGSSACTESKMLHTPYLIHFGFWTSCQDANTHVAPMKLLSWEHRQGRREQPTRAHGKVKRRQL